MPKSHYTVSDAVPEFHVKHSSEIWSTIIIQFANLIFVKIAEDKINADAR
jgi:hypothetical protein